MVKPLYFQNFESKYLENENRFFNSVKSSWIVHKFRFISVKHAKICLDPPYRLKKRKMLAKKHVITFDNLVIPCHYMVETCENIAKPVIT